MIAFLEVKVRHDYGLFGEIAATCFVELESKL